MSFARFLETRSPLPGVSNSTFLIIILATATPVIIAVLYALFRAIRLVCMPLVKKTRKGVTVLDCEAAKTYPAPLNIDVVHPYTPFRFKSKSERLRSEHLNPKGDFKLSPPVAAKMHPSPSEIARLVRPPSHTTHRVAPPTLTRAQIGDILIGTHPDPPAVPLISTSSIAARPMLEPIYTFNVGLTPSIRANTLRKAVKGGTARNTGRGPLMVTHANGSLSWHVPAPGAHKVKPPRIEKRIRASVGKENMKPIPF